MCSKQGSKHTVSQAASVAITRVLLLVLLLLVRLCKIILSL
jgi:hypothetical protein